MKPLFQSVLIVDDDEDDQFLIQVAFKESKITNPVVFLGNGMQLMEYLKKTMTDKWNYPAFILMDLNMPLMKGKETLKVLKTDPTFSFIPIIILSTSNSEKEINDCYQLGASCYLVKSGSPQDISSLFNYLTN